MSNHSMNDANLMTDSYKGVFCYRIAVKEYSVTKLHL